MITTFAKIYKTFLNKNPESIKQTSNRIYITTAICTAIGVNINTGSNKNYKYKNHIVFAIDNATGTIHKISEDTEWIEKP